MEMEKSCEFCLLLRPIVYCKADAALLCLPCDAKVHSANALSNRHPRTLVCETCRHHPAFVQCSQHQMFMCHGCDRSQHDLSSQHQRKVISSFMGCPSAKDFAALWGFDLNELDDCTFQDQYISPSNATVDKGMLILDTPRQSCSGEGLSLVSDETSTLSALPKVGSNRRKHPKLTRATETGKHKANQQEDMSDILQQILDLKRLQLNQGTGTSSFVRDHEETDLSSFKFNTMWKRHDNLDQHLQHSLDLSSSLQSFGCPPEKSAAEPCPFLFPQLDGDASWLCRSPIQNGQLWPQNMQDLGVCDDGGCFDDFSMPEVDLTFKSIEELFANEQELDRALLDDKDTSCFSVEKDLSFDKSDNSYERSMEVFPAASSVYMSRSANHDKDIDSPDNVDHFLNTKECPSRSIRPSYSMLSSSRLSAESIEPEYHDSEPSSTFSGQQHSCTSSDLDSAQVHSKENVISRLEEKKKIRRNKKQTCYTTRKPRSDVKRLVRGQFVKTESCEQDTISVSRSF